VDSLQQKGCLQRGPDAEDRRVSRISLTAEGSKIFSLAQIAFEESMQARLWDLLSPQETARLATTFKRIQGDLGIQGGGLLPPTREGQG
jgi:DNA-binding MarR family transcriptional regulator